MAVAARQLLNVCLRDREHKQTFGNSVHLSGPIDLRLRTFPGTTTKSNTQNFDSGGGRETFTNQRVVQGGASSQELPFTVIIFQSGTFIEHFPGLKSTFKNHQIRGQNGSVVQVPGTS